MRNDTLTFSVSRSLTVGSGVLVDILTRLDLQSASFAWPSVSTRSASVRKKSGKQLSDS